MRPPAPSWGENTAKRWLARMVKHCDGLEGRPVDAITRRELADVLTPLRREHHETARKVRQGLAKVFRWVRANDYRADDPADDALGELVEAVNHVPQHRESLHYTEVAGALHKVRFGYALRVTALAFEFLVLTAARSSEVRFMTWEEVNLNAAIWEIPAERMKGDAPIVCHCLTKPLPFCGRSSGNPIPTPPMMIFTSLSRSRRAMSFGCPTARRYPRMRF